MGKGNEGKSLPVELEIGFLKLDEEGKILYLDEGASSLLGISPGEVASKTFLWEFFRPFKSKANGEEIFKEFVKNLSTKGRIYSSNVYLAPKDRAPFYAVLRGKAVSEGDKRIIYVSLIKLPIEREIYLNIFEDVPIAFFRIDLNNRFEFIDDEGARRILGYKAEELIGKRVHEIHFDEVSAENLFTEITRALSERDRIRVRQVLLKGADGSPVWVTSVIRGIYDEKGNLLGREGVMIKSSFLDTLARNLNDKDSFISMLGHDVRALTGSAISFLDLLLETDLDDLQRKLVDRAYASIYGVKRLLENYIYSYRIRTGKVEVLNLPFDINDTIDYLKTVVMPYIKEGVEFRVNVPDFPFLLMGDAPKLEQILLNLLMNAAKVTERGFIELSVEKLRRMI